MSLGRKGMIGLACLGLETVCVSSGMAQTPSDTLGSVSAVIGEAGGTLTLNGVGSISFRPGAWHRTQRVVLDAFVSWFQGSDFDDVAAGGSSGAFERTQYVVRVMADTVPEQFAITLRVPPEMLERAGPDPVHPLIFTKQISGGAYEFFDHYTNVSTEYDSDAGTVRATLPGRGHFTIERRPDGRAELLIFIGIRGTWPSAVSSAVRVHDDLTASSRAAIYGVVLDGTPTLAHRFLWGERDGPVRLVLDPVIRQFRREDEPTRHSADWLAREVRRPQIVGVCTIADGSGRCETDERSMVVGLSFIYSLPEHGVVVQVAMASVTFTGRWVGRVEYALHLVERRDGWVVVDRWLFRNTIEER